METGSLAGERVLDQVFVGPSIGFIFFGILRFIFCSITEYLGIVCILQLMQGQIQFTPKPNISN